MPDPHPRAPDFVYAIYIGAPLDTVWNGLIDREVTKLYWGQENRSDWKQGSRWEHVNVDGSGKVVLVGKVLEVDPPRRMVISWCPTADEGNEAKTSRVTFELTPNGDETLLQVTHSDLQPGSEMDVSVRQGWVVILSNLKTLLETGKTLPGLA